MVLVPMQSLAKLHPAGLSDDWADKLAGQDFFSRASKATFEHYMQVRQAGTFSGGGDLVDLMRGCSPRPAPRLWKSLGWWCSICLEGCLICMLPGSDQPFSHASKGTECDWCLVPCMPAPCSAGFARGPSCAIGFTLRLPDTYFF